MAIDADGSVELEVLVVNHEVEGGGAEEPGRLADEREHHVDLERADHFDRPVLGEAPPGQGPVSANVDSEYRFYSSWYHVLDVLLLVAARRPEADTRIVRACAGGFLLAACGRALSIRVAGRPHRFQTVLVALEFVISVVVVPWRERVARAAGGNR